ncbi:hypothetical protein SAMN05660860_01213 [Geoalkalibacter ferrihydriticus]|uniref:Uncharacterized protein n=1 Tax=Geoalkalibacter ferrihydriticus TaxID=392333 RepID=A0A1G9MP55_9BACT|nr:hypothetical protein [Geoalkalibacter ferrihydriticus]SDL76048.1 hypothetical protein SAMN05660860_01213 [Geoalkalibacter ferrihydriticus]
MTVPLIKILVALALPVVLFFGGGYLMLLFTARDQFPQTSAPESVPLHFRLGGYNAEQAQAYWAWLGAEGQLAELRFLEVDLVFPLVYGGALLVSLFLIWGWLGRPFRLAWLLAPLAVTVIADWTENLVHWHQLHRVLRQEPVQDFWMHMASLATTTKMLCFTLSATLLVALALKRLARISRGMG